MWTAGVRRRPAGSAAMTARTNREHEEPYMSGQVTLEIDGKIATITNHNPDKHNAFDDDMDAQLFAALAELRQRPDVKVVIWQGEGKSFSSGRDVASIGTNVKPVSHHE